VWSKKILKLTNESTKVLDRLVNALVTEFSNPLELMELAGALKFASQEDMIEYCKERIIAHYEAKASGLQS
jgi:hypothetical protein